MSGYHDVYVLAPERSAAVADRFLAAFAPGGEAVAAAYEFPQYAAEPSVTFATAAGAIRYCAERPSEPQSLYFSARGGKAAWAMLFFTSDGGLILGLSVVDGEDEAFAQLKEHAGSTIGYVTFESPPHATAAEFQQAAEAANG